ncbi:MAG: 2Fe-2S iron-sulfur cluster-binding protein, partial [Desulfobacterales bacterium]
MQPGKYTIHLASENMEIQAEEGQTVLEALIAAGIFLRTDCGGKGSCGKCRIKILSPLKESASAPEESEIKILGPSDLRAGFRLACRLTVSENIRLIVPETSRLSAEVAQKG